jgi:hypothetical protein
VPTWVDAAVLIALLVCAWRLVGRISPTVAAQRRVYAKFVGLPADVARYSLAQAEDLRERLAKVLATEGRSLAAGYRDGPDPRDSWREVALNPRVDHAPYLEAALTRARLEYHFAPRRDRRALAEVHARIWQKLAGKSVP